MQFNTIATSRLDNQHILHPELDSAADIVAHMGAMQAQDYGGALWSIGLRSKTLTRDDVERAIEGRQILRTWPMRGTIHFLAADDARWITQLTAERTVRSAASRSRELEIDDASVDNCRKLVEKLLRDGPIERQAIMNYFEENGESTKGQRGYHMLWRLAADGVVCFGPHHGKQPTFALLDQWISKSKSYSRDESLYELAKRYFTSHGPATIKDFAGWASITSGEARQAINSAADVLASTTLKQGEYWHAADFAPTKTSSAFLLPGFDEFMLGYKDRSPALAAEHANKIVPGGNGMFKSTIVVDGQVIGTWKKTERKQSTYINLEAFDSINDNHRKRLQHALERYGAFLEQPTVFTA